MKIVFLAGGVSRRMWPISQDKLLLGFMGKPLFQHVLERIANTKLFDEYIIVASPRNKNALSTIAQNLGIKAQMVEQIGAKGMADAVFSAADLIDGEVLIVNADDILEGKLFEQIVKLVQAQKGTPFEADVVISGIEVETYIPRGYLKLDGDKVVGIVEKPGEGREPSKMIKLVTDYFRDGRQLIEYLKNVKTGEDDVYEMALDQMIKAGINVRFNQYQGDWGTIKYPWDILTVMDLLLKNIEHKIDPTAQISKTAVIDGKVVIESGVKVFDGAVVRGPVYIGKDCIIGGNSLVRDSILGQGCVTGFNTEIARSYVGTNSWFHTNYIGDAVIEGDFGAGSGAVLANLRLDSQTVKVGQDRIDTKREKLGLIAGRGVRVGVNVSTMPGIKIGANSLIGPGVVLNKDVEENTQIVLKQEYLVSTDSTNKTSYNQFKDKLK